MKASRRKQTNPNRVAAGTRDIDPLVNVGLDNSDTTANWKEEEAEQSRDSVEEDASSNPEMTNGELADSEQPLNMHVSVNTFSICPEGFSSQGQLRDRKTDVLVPDAKKPRVEVSLENYPTAYHKLGRELQETTDLPLTNGHLKNELSPVASATYSIHSPREMHSLPSQLLPSERTGEESLYPDQSQSSPQDAPKINKESSCELANGKSDRIFHMDAYCELCDREFCNKYFLKTHKANKHGIYEDNSPPASSVPLPFPGLMMPQDHLSSFNFKMDAIKPPSSEPILPWSFKLESPSPHTKKPDSSPDMKPAESSMPFFQMPIPGLESSSPNTNKNSNSGGNGCNFGSLCSSSSNTSNTTSILTTITNSIKSGTSSSNSLSQAQDPSMEDYCHICQKHFCNKYYLKKHKQDVHGIAPENPPSISNKRSRSSLLDLPMTPNNHMMLPQPLASLAGMHGLPGIHGLPGMSNMPPGLMVINPYSLPPVAIIPAGSLMPGQQIHQSIRPIISQSMSMTTMSDSALLSHAPHTPVSSHSTNSSDHTPKPSPNFQEVGAHCSICSKEFCNEFYLQIHKESKHGIRRGSDDGPRDKATSAGKESKHERSSPPVTPNVIKSEASVARLKSPADPVMLGDGHFIFCNLCNKDFTNKYLYRIHRIHDHGLNELIDPSLVENGELHQKENAMRNMNESLMRMTAGVPSMSYPSSYGNSPSNKPQESAACDICNKQMTNQYFLRVHKFNVHGIDPSTNEKYEQRSISSPVIPISKPRTPTSSGSLSITSYSQPLNMTSHPGKHHMLPFLPPKIDFKDMSPFADFTRDFKSFRDVPSFLADTINHELFARSQNQARHLDLNFFGLPSLGKMQCEDNVKMNFDPEAYCEICKKEFCSKYFLRTHKQNIHGIKSDTSSSSSSKGSESEKIMSISPVKPIINSSIGKSSDGLDKNAWRWKEPINSSRVICDICNKEVCNKYFLRTHKQKKHGIVPTSQSPNISTNGSPIASDCDTASNASSQPDEKSFRLDALSFPHMIPLPSAERLQEKFNMKSLNFDKGKDIIPLNNNTEQSETCNICNRRFKNLNWLKDHIVKEHSNCEALDMRSKCSPPVYTCQVCGADFPAELSVQLHLIQEHNARVTLDTDEPQVPTEEATLPNGEGNSKVAELSGRWTLRKKGSSHRRLKKYVCSRCGFDSHWLSSLLDHERHEHGIVTGTAPAFSCRSCHLLLPTSNALSAHMVIAHGFTSEDALHEVKLTEPTVPNNFRCAHCQAVFPTRSWGMAHVRHVHIRSRRDLAVKNTFEKSLLRCSLCPFKTHFAFRLHRHMKCRHTNNLPSSNSIYSSSSSSSSSSRITPNETVRKFSHVPSPNNTTREDKNLLGSNAMYKSIAASLLSAPETGRAESPIVDREDILLHSFKLPMGPNPVESAPFKLATHTSAVVGL